MYYEATEGAVTRLSPDAVDLVQVRRELTVIDRAAARAAAAGRFRFSKKKRPSIIEEYHLDGTGLYVPRFYRPPLLPGVELGRVRVGPRFAGRSPLQSRIVLRPEQEEPLDAVLQHPEGILHLGCGQGKTVLALEAMARLARGPVLVSVPTSTLLTQWLLRIKEHLRDVAGGVGIVGDSKIDWQHRGLVVGLIQSLSMRDWPPEFFEYFDWMVVDEGHRSAAEVYSRIYWRFLAKRLELTATWERSDGRHKITLLHCGDVIYSDVSQQLTPRIFFLETGVIVKDPNDMYAWPRVVSRLAEHEGRNRLIVKNVMQAAQRNRRVLVLGDRVEQLEKLWAACLLPAEDKGLIIGKMSRSERATAIERRVVFATTKLAREGLDHKPLDTLMILYPFKDRGSVQQAIGRILRVWPGKGEPLVVIFEDKGCPTAMKMALGMRKALKELGYSWEPRQAKAA